MMRKTLGRMAAMGRAVVRVMPHRARLERFEMQRMAASDRRHLWLSFVCCVALLG